MLPEAVGPAPIVQLKSSLPTQSNQLQVPASKSQLLAGGNCKVSLSSIEKDLTFRIKIYRSRKKNKHTSLQMLQKLQTLII